MEETKESNPFIGQWYIYEMEMWDEDYFNMETPAYVEIKANNQGSFQFGLVTGYLEQIGEHERFAFTWDGNDEMDEANGSGCIRLINEDESDDLPTGTWSIYHLCRQNL